MPSPETTGTELPEGIARHRAGGLDVHMLAERADALLSAGIHDLPGLVKARPQVREFRGRRSVWSFPLAPDGSGPRAVWRHASRGGLMRFLLGDLFHGRPRRPFRELEVSLEARRRGVPTPAVIAALVRNLPLGFYRGDVLLDELEGGLDGLDWLRTHRGARPGRRRRIFRMAGRTVARAHRGGLDHPDLNVKNLFVLPTGDCHVLDLDGASLSERLPWARRLFCLRRLHRSLRKQEGLSGLSLASPRDLLAFLQGYAASRAEKRRVLRSRPWRRRPPSFLLFWNLVLVLFLPLVALWLLWEVKRSRRFARSWQELLALRLPPPRSADEKETSVLVHGASVGEIVAALPLLRRLEGPERTVHVTTTTETGAETARRHVAPERVRAMPLDLPGRAGRLLDRIDPELLILMETELWPGLIWAAHERGIPLLVANGRLSPSRMKRYERLRWFYRPILELPDAFLMQSEGDGGRLRTLGAPCRRIRVLGNLKMDQIADNLASPRRAAIADTYRLDDRPLFVAGSTHPGEDLAVIRAWREARIAHPRLRLLLAPRHLERGRELAAALVREGISFVRRSENESIRAPDADVILADGMGELAFLYEHGQVCFVGGSLVPVGGHSPLEPAVFARPVLWGPHMFNFEDACALLGRSGGGRTVEDAEELARALVELFGDDEKRAVMARGAREAMARDRGAADRMMDVARAALEGRLAR